MASLTAVQSIVALPALWWQTHRRSGLALLYAVVAALLAVPQITSTVPFGIDDLNHLARIYVLAHIDTDPDLARIFEIRSEIVPYSGMDWLLTPMARVLPVMLVGRLYLLALAWGLVAAVALLRWSFTGGIGITPAFAGVIAYNGLMAWGMINYELGVILLLTAFAAWHACRAKHWLVRLVMFVGPATVLYLTHLLAFVVYGLSIAGYEVFGRAGLRRASLTDWLALTGQFIPGLLLWMFSSPSMIGTVSIRFDPITKPMALAFPFVFRGAGGGADFGLGTALICGTFLVMGYSRGWYRLPRAVAGTVVYLIALTLVAPFQLLGTAMIDFRFSIVAACLALGTIRTTDAGRRFLRPAVAMVTALTVLQIADITVLTRHYDAQYTEFRRGIAVLPRGAEVVSVMETPRFGPFDDRLRIYDHMPQLVTIDRSGYAPDFFARVTNVGVRDGRASDRHPNPADMVATAPPASYVLWFHLGMRRRVPGGMVSLYRGSFFDIFATAPAADPD